MKRKRVFKPDFISIDCGYSSHIGQRQQNQDAIHVTSEQVSIHGKGRLFAIADGMGGHLGGGLASRLACSGLSDYYNNMNNKQLVARPSDVSRYLAETIIRLDRYIRLKSLGDSGLEDMGTTLSCLVITDTSSIIAHVGDSRIYRLRQGHLTCMTVDHTFVQDMIFEGEVDPDRAHLHLLRHMLTRAVGTGEPLELVDSRVDTLKIKDCFLLCSDGLYNTLTVSCILDLLSRHTLASETAEGLVRQALQNGARDNITAIVIKIE